MPSRWIFGTCAGFQYRPRIEAAGNLLPDAGDVMATIRVEWNQFVKAGTGEAERAIWTILQTHGCSHGGRIGFVT
jgi:hypothetical protein